MTKNAARIKAVIIRRRSALADLADRIAALPAGATKTYLIAWARADLIGLRALARDLLDDADCETMRFRVSGGGLQCAVLCERQEQVDALLAAHPAAMVEDRL